MYWFLLRLGQDARLQNQEIWLANISSTNIIKFSLKGDFFVEIDCIQKTPGFRPESVKSSNKLSLGKGKDVSKQQDGAEVQHCNNCSQGHLFACMKCVKTFHGIWILSFYKLRLRTDYGFPGLRTVYSSHLYLY